MAESTALNPKQERFVAEYLVDLNATQAAIRAGYSKRTAYAQGCRLLKHAEVAAQIASRREKRAEETGITSTRVLKELELLAFSDLTHYTVDDNGRLALAEGAPDGAMRALQSVKHRVTIHGNGDDAIVTRECELKLWNKPEPLKLAGKHTDTHGFADRVEVTGKDGGPIPVSFYLPDNGRRRPERKAG